MKNKTSFISLGEIKEDFPEKIALHLSKYIDEISIVQMKEQHFRKRKLKSNKCLVPVRDFVIQNPTQSWHQV